MGLLCPRGWQEALPGERARPTFAVAAPVSGHSERSKTNLTGYDLIDNDGYPSADRVLEEYEHTEVGDWAFPMNGFFGIRFPVNETTAFKVKAFETNQWLLWEKPDCTWAWVLRPLPGGRTRLISRQRMHYPEPFTMLLMEFSDPPMMRRILKGIKARAELVGAAPEAARD